LHLRQLYPEFKTNFLLLSIFLVLIQEFTLLWRHTSQIALQDDVSDSIVWKLTVNGAYSYLLAYKVQFAGTIRSSLEMFVWKAWARPPNASYSLWTAERLERRGCPNGRVCPLSRCHDESAAHLLFKCRYSVRILIMLRDWLHIHDFDPSSWSEFDSVECWWTSMVFAHGGTRKAMASLVMLVTWHIWNEKNENLQKHERYAIYHFR
jgi:hypothetical protein